MNQEPAPEKGTRPEYRLAFLDQRESRGKVTAENLTPVHEHLVSSFTNVTDPAWDESELYRSERFLVDIRFPLDVSRSEIIEVLRWIGSHATEAGVDAWIEQWERWRLLKAGVRVNYFPPLLDAAMKRLYEDAEAIERAQAIAPAADLCEEDPSLGEEASSETLPAASPRTRRRSAHGRRLRYAVLRKSRHAELVFRRDGGKGEVRAVAKVDLADLELVTRHNWHVSGSEATGLSLETELRPNGPQGELVRLTLHRLIAGAAPGESVAFRSGDRLDFRRANLVVGPEARKLHRTNTTGFRGVSFNSKAGKYEAAVGSTRLGLFPTAEEADAAARAERERRGWSDVPSRSASPSSAQAETSDPVPTPPDFP